MKEESKINITTKDVRDAREEKNRMALEIMLDVEDVEEALDNLKHSIRTEIKATPGIEMTGKLREMEKLALHITGDLGQIKILCGGLRAEPKHEVWK